MTLDSDSRDWLHTKLILRERLRMVDNAVRNIRAHMYVHLAVGLLVVVMLVGGGTAMFRLLFGFLMRQEVFGPILMDQLVGFVLLLFFSLLGFSSLVVTLSTTYISREVEYLMAQPISRQAIFRLKLGESLFYSSWAFALLSFPLFVSYGLSRNAVWYYYPLVAVLVTPFLLIPASIGSLVTMALAAYFPARKTRVLAIALGVVSMGVTLLTARAMGLKDLLRAADKQDFGQVLATLSVGNAPLFPSSWLANGLRTIGPVNRADIDILGYLYWFGMLASTALFLLEVQRWLVPKLYYRGWCLSRDSAFSKEAAAGKGVRPWAVVDRMLGPLPPAIRALLSKDMKAFWRDPSQWSQLVVLLGLMIVYISNLHNASRHAAALEFIAKDWRTLLTFFNLAASCFILSILTTRFVYPMLSLEGRQFWTIGLAPIPRTRIVWQKFILCAGASMVIVHLLTALSNVVLGVEPFWRGVTHATVTVMAFGLTSLSIGLGAILPSFREDNPARIANGVGGTLNVIMSLIYIVGSVATLLFPMVILGDWMETGGHRALIAKSIIGVGAIFQVAVIWLPMHLGLKRWNAHEF